VLRIRVCGAASNGDKRFSDGNIDGTLNTALLNYWSTNHPGLSFPGGDPTGRTRFDVYRYEIDNNLIPNLSATGGETGRRRGSSADSAEIGQRCSGQEGVNNAVRDRRELLLAVVNCLHEDLHGSEGGRIVPVIDFAKMFITEPVLGSSESTLWVEMLGTVEPGDESGILHEFPVLYR
jgi:hypothetical protein